jgi:hypothetical protein
MVRYAVQLVMQVWCSLSAGAARFWGWYIRPGTAGRQLSLELLEERCLPSSFYWTGAKSANWSNPGNWHDESGNVGLPQAGGTVIVGKDFTGLPLFPANDLTVDFNVQIGTIELLVPRKGGVGFPQSINIDAGKILTVTEEFDQFDGSVNGNANGPKGVGAGEIALAGASAAHYFWYGGSIRVQRSSCKPAQAC